MPDIIKNTPPTAPARSNAFKLTKDYFFHSNEKITACCLLIGTVFCVIGLVGLMAVYGWWSAAFWAALTAKAFSPFLVCLAQFCVLAAAYTVFSIAKTFLMGKLSIRWRNWLTNKIIIDLFNSKNNYLELRRASPEIDNIAQRIQEDVKSFVELILDLGTNLLDSALSLVTFVGTLWIIAGPLIVTVSSLTLTIPGYLVWVALGTAIAASIITHFIGKSLSKAILNAEQAEANLRESLIELTENSENVAEEDAESYYKKSILDKINDINIAANKALNTQTRLLAFQSVYSQVINILPRILAAPLYFSGLIEIGQLMQIGLAFSEVNSSLSWFVQCFQSLTRYQTSINRILELQQAFDNEAMNSNARSVYRKVRDKESIKVKQLTILTPTKSSTDHILTKLDLKLVPKQHTLFKGPSGCGKSTLFKAISGTWTYGDGKISIPSGKKLYFLPQRPTLPNDTLKAVLSYPESMDTYPNEAYAAALKAVGGMDRFIDRLEEKSAWSKELSGGQQQKISFARALLKKPDWLFLDEATSALDEPAEEHVYRLVTESMKSTTVISIAHRNTVQKFHQRTVMFSTVNQPTNTDPNEPLQHQKTQSAIL